MHTDYPNCAENGPFRSTDASSGKRRFTFYVIHSSTATAFKNSFCIYIGGRLQRGRKFFYQQITHPIQEMIMTEPVNAQAGVKPVALTRESSLFTGEVIRRSGVNVNLCWHCKCCSSGCPFSEAMDFLPNQVIRLIQLGFRQDALRASSIWICVGCNTCSMECPQAIDIAVVMDTLGEMAIEEGIAVGEPDILNFHKEVLDSIRRYGRTHKLEIMMRYKIRKRDWFSDMDVGIKMLAKRKLDLRPSRVKQIEAVRGLFDKYGKEKKG